MRRIALLALALPLGGCISAARTIVMAPVHAVSFTADKLTTSRAEADRNLGRKVREQRERDARACRRERKDAGGQARAAADCAVRAGY